jgi:hypothetical protein
MIAGEPIIFVVENDWRMRRFICAVLKYSTHALVVESSGLHGLLLRARHFGREMDMLILNIELAGRKQDRPRPRNCRRESVDGSPIDLRQKPAASRYSAHLAVPLHPVPDNGVPALRQPTVLLLR